MVKKRKDSFYKDETYFMQVSKIVESSQEGLTLF